MQSTTRTTQTTGPAALILEALDEQGRSQTWLAGRLGMNVKTLNAYLLGRRTRPQDEMVKRAAELLGIPRSVMSQFVDTASVA
jgi:transcriptional regulator with XRE-family HTH domain